MSKLIGTNPNQVPSNADLGTAAFMDKKDFLLSKGSEMSAIEAVIPKTAVDVFIYDTTKDSDGGAWRKRVQHTSWYNERLNTTTRGNRREFPVVAVIVAEATKITIYDGDDINMPMWMVFDGGDYSDFIYGIGNGTVTAVHMLNAKLCVTINDPGAQGGLDIVDFIADTGHYINESVGGPYLSKGNISTRNDGLNLIVDRSFYSRIVDRYCNDVAMTVLPNAPIDSVTGLPVPTIAVATDGGVSVIKDDGSVVDYTGSSGYSVSSLVNFTKDYRIRMTLEASGQRYYRTFNIGSSDKVISQWDPTEDDGLTLYLNYANGDAVMLGSPVLNATEKAVSSSTGLTFFEENITVPKQSLVSHATSSYNTGWMHGDIKLAILSDTDATNVTGTELITNGTFGTSSNWTADGDTGLSISGGQATITLTTTAGTMYQNLPTLAAGTYTFSIDWVGGGTQPNVYVTLQDATSSGTRYTLLALAGNATGSHSSTVTISSTEPNLRIAVYGYFWGGTGGGTTLIVDNVSIRLAEEDRSYNNKGLQVHGTITKTAVATGADLVAYSGFSANNYLLQPYNSDLNFGTGDFSISAWVQLPTAGSPTRGIICEREGTDYSWQFFQYNSRFYFYVGSSSAPAYTSQAYSSYGIWYNVVVGVKNGKIFIYVNGEYNIEVAGTPTTVTATDAVLSVGVQTNATSEPFTGGQIALLRISATAPSAEQIKKMYNDEKYLFQENAKATLYGTSDAVTALAYDDDTELLHVGTSAGRSDFHGLRRINNTTRAIGTAISAVDGFIVEE